MKNQLLIAVLVVFTARSYSQSNDTIDLHVKNINLDLLKSPTNPAFLLMNTSPSEIIEPGSAPEFYTSIQNASKNFSVIPNNIGFSVTPFWWTEKARRLSFDSEFDSINKFNFFRTTTISGGLVQGVNDDAKLWRYGVGFQSTLLRGRCKAKNKTAYLSKLREYHTAYYGEISAYIRQNADYNSLEAERTSTIIKIQSIDKLVKSGSIDATDARNQKIQLLSLIREIQNKQDTLRTVLSQKYNSENTSLSSNEELDKLINVMNKREGFKWDVGGGLSLNAHDNKIDSIGLYRAGIWSNFGSNLISSASGSSNFAAYALVRYLFYNEINYKTDEAVSMINNMSTFDIGVKVQYEAVNKFTFGLETIFRLGISNSVYESTYRINGLMQYYLGKNRLLYASFGNNLNESSNSGPQDLVVTFGINIGFGGNIDIYGAKL